MGYYERARRADRRIAKDKRNEENLDEIMLEKKLEQARETEQAMKEHDERWDNENKEWIK